MAKKLSAVETGKFREMEQEGRKGGTVSAASGKPAAGSRQKDKLSC